MNRHFVILLSLALLLISGCAAPLRDRGAVPGEGAHATVADVARSLIGVPYRFGGASPRGMDCSGLVHYSYGKIGISVPRTVAQQRRNAFPVPLDDLQEGDLLFFRLDGREVTHVGIYLGKGRFIHAPRTGKRVSIASMGNGYWKRRLAGAGRFY